MSEEKLPVHEARKWIVGWGKLDLPADTVYVQGNNLNRWRRSNDAGEIESVLTCELGIVSSEVSGACHWWLARDNDGKVIFAAISWFAGNLRLYDTAEIVYDERLPGKYSPWFDWKVGVPLPDDWKSAYD